jgi:hypothetical protein
VDHRDRPGAVPARAAGQQLGGRADRRGRPLGEVLRVVDAYDAGDVGGRDLAGHYMEAIRWSARATGN